MPELGVGYVSIVPKFASGFKKNIESEMSGSFSKIEQHGKTSFKNIFSTATKLATATAGAMGTAISAKKIFGGGLKRLMGIEEAQAKMKGLGFTTTQVKDAMDAAADSVDGTAYSLDAAATTAAQLMASGRSGEALAQTLKTVANSASAAGIGMADMGSIFSKVAATGKAQNDVLQQVSDRGIPIYQKLGEQMGITTDEVFKLASQGKISAQQFEDAMAAASGNVAKEMGGTLKGSIDNFNSALSRLGAGFLDGIFPYLAPALQTITQRIKDMVPAAKMAGNAFAKATVGLVGGVKSFVDASGPAASGWLGGVQAGVQTAAGSVRSFYDGWRAQDADVATGNRGAAAWGASVRDGLSNATQALREFFSSLTQSMGGVSGIFESFRGIIPLVTGPLGIVKSAVVDTFKNLDVDPTGLFAGIGQGASEAGQKVGAGLKNILDQVGNVTGSIVSSLSDVLSQLLPVVLDTVGSIADSVGPVLADLASQLGDLFGQIGPLFADLARDLGPLLGDVLGQLGAELGNALKTLLPMLGEVARAIMPMISEVLRTLLPALGELVRAVLPPLMQAIQLLLPPLMDVVGQILPIIIDLASKLAPILGEIVSALAPLIEGLIGALTPILESLVTNWFPQLVEVLDVVASIIGELAQMIAPIIRIIVSALMPVIELISGFLADVFLPIISKIVHSVVKVLGPALQGLAQIVKRVVQVIDGVIRGTLEPMSQFWNTVWGSIKGFFVDIWNSISSFSADAVNAVLSFFLDLPGQIWDSVKDIGSWLFDSGKALIDGFLKGIASAWGNLTRWVSDGMGKLRRLFPFSPAKEGPFSGRGYVTYSGKALATDFGKSIAAQAGFVQAQAESLLGSARAGLDGSVTATMSRVVRQPGGDGPQSSPAGFGSAISVNIGAINNPLGEPTAISINRELQKMAALSGGLA